ncbi:MAG: replicative DNA helicase [Planctomycetes bacterium]|nr:replicative DNA helicase [Planctomycetota bacterium]
MQAAEDRGVPRNVDAERSVLGALLLDAGATADVSQILSPEDFYVPAHQQIYQVILDTYDRRSHTDVLACEEELSRRGELDAVGGRTALLHLLDSVVSAAGVAYHAEIVREKSIQRQLLETCLEISRMSYENAADARELLETAEERIFKIARMNVANEVRGIDSVLQETFERIDFFRSQRGEPTGLVTDYHDFDEMTGGLQRGELVIIAARPSMGKTTFALNLAERVASTNKGVVIFSLEMSAQQVISNMLCCRAQVDGQSVRRGRLTDQQYARLQQEAERLYEAPIFVDDSAALTPSTLRAKCRRLKQQHDVQLVVVDYLQLMSGGRRIESRQQEIALISRSLKGLARELEIPVVALSQLNRDVEGREDHRPRMSDLRESGAIEQDADVICLLHREEYFKRTEENAGLAQLIIAKQRNGPTGDVTLRFFREFMRFENYQRRSEPLG